MVTDTVATGASDARRRLAHSAIGAGAGLVIGAGAGAAVGYYMDRQDTSESMFPATIAVGAMGGMLGLVIGAIAGALVR